MRMFELDPRLGRDTFEVVELGLCSLRLMNDCRWPWLMLVPSRSDITEVYDLSPPDQALLIAETARVAKAAKAALGADKINIAALGNVVPTFHMHVVARFAGDPNWPGPVFGFAAAVPYDEAGARRLAQRLGDAVLAS